VVEAEGRGKGGREGGRKGRREGGEEGGGVFFLRYLLQQFER